MKKHIGILVFGFVLVAGFCFSAKPVHVEKNEAGKFSMSAVRTNLNNVIDLALTNEAAIAELESSVTNAGLSEAQVLTLIDENAGPPADYDEISALAQSAVQEGVEETPTFAGVEVVNALMSSNSVIPQWYADATYAQISSANSIMVDLGDTAVENATALRAAYILAKAKTPYGMSRSISNRVAVLLPTGQYDVEDSPLVLDAEYIDLIAVNPSSGQPTQNLKEYYNGITQGDEWLKHEIEWYSPPSTVVFSAEPNYVIEQAATNIQLIGFGIVTKNQENTFDEDRAALYVSAAENDGSYYEQMYLFGFSSEDNFKYATYFDGDLRGTWRDCIASANAWRIINSDFEPTMYNCQAGVFSFIGDGFPADGAMNCYLENCKAGDGSFAGCAAFTGPILAEATFVDCVGGDKCFGQAAEVAGTFLRCRAGDYSFGGNFSKVDIWPNAPANFSGYAEDCIAGKASFGGSIEPVNHILSGTLVRCVTENNIQPFYVQGATIRDSVISMASTNTTDALILTDSSTKITGSQILVGVSGIPINAESTQNVVVFQSLMNNGDDYPSGFGSNVINLVSVPYNAVEGAPKGIDEQLFLGTTSGGTDRTAALSFDFDNNMLVVEVTDD